ncbi:hypothetical protein SAMN05421542_2418 [Chryseobacterium jejuense]|uniref:Uncharacterized protein n=1 Tax=Chryseobacterium jejuense TaxID=445960 RepID=A0A2X2VPL8_CHRJE|nr:hypothetical protein SAMN05421542_2418 [Chryseobacterium jejuense]SQB27123.1 Uncharacterised protein [Chryseobacterium jejuense]
MFFLSCRETEDYLLLIDEYYFDVVNDKIR